MKKSGMKVFCLSQISEELYEEMKPGDADSHYVQYAITPRREIVRLSNNSPRKLMPRQEL